MRTLVVASTLAILTGLSFLSPPGLADDLQDGITARILPVGVGITQEVLRPNADGTYSVSVTIFQKAPEGTWSQVAQNGTLHVYTIADNTIEEDHNVDTSDGIHVSAHVHATVDGNWNERATVDFTSKTLGGQTVKFPASAVANPDGTGATNLLDVVVEFSGDHDGSTSHYSINRNELYNFKQYDAADALDNSATVYPVALGQ